jgi:hypothetical protein
MTRIVISQPMFFPWMGLFEQIRLADVFVHYDDVQLPSGRSFMNRVQIKTPNGTQWLTAPILRNEKQIIKDTQFDDTQFWRQKHLKTLKLNYIKAPFHDEMMTIAEELYNLNTPWLCEFNMAAIEKIANYFQLNPRFERSSAFPATSRSTERLLELTRYWKGTCYITGHGARNYLDHSVFEQQGIQVGYMHYELKQYPQLHGAFTPYVSILDLIANTGHNGVNLLCSQCIDWKEFILCTPK